MGPGGSGGSVLLLSPEWDCLTEKCLLQYFPVVFSGELEVSCIYLCFLLCWSVGKGQKSSVSFLTLAHHFFEAEKLLWKEEQSLLLLFPPCYCFCSFMTRCSSILPVSSASPMICVRAAQRAKLHWVHLTHFNISKCLM